MGLRKKGTRGASRAKRESGRTHNEVFLLDHDPDIKKVINLHQYSQIIQDYAFRSRFQLNASSDEVPEVL